MAFVKNMERYTNQNRVSKHKDAETIYFSTEINGEKIFQLSTLGSSTREVKGAVSQTLQFDKNSAIELIEILKKEFEL